MTAIQTRLHRAGFRREHLPLFLYFACFITLGAGSSLLGVAWPSIQATFGLPLDAVGILLLVSTIGFVLAGTVAGPLTGRLGIGRFLLLSNSILALALLGYAFAPGWWVMILLTLFGGLGAGGFDIGLNIFVAENYGVRVMNWTHATFGVGATLGPLLMTAAVTSAPGWRMGYVIVGMLMALLSLFFIPLIRTRRVAAADTAAATQAGTTPAVPIARPRETLRQPLVWLGILLFMIYAGAEVTVGQWVFALFTESRGITPEIAGLFVSLFWGGLTAGRLLMGALAPRLGAVALVRYSMIAVCLSAALLWIPHPIVSMVSVIAIGFSLAAIFPTLTSDTPRRVGPQHAPNAIGYQVSAASIGIALLPGLAGVLADSINLEVIIPFVLVVSLIMLLLNEIILRLVQSKPPDL
jgi:fucose permease